MARWAHPKKDIREALRDVAAADGLDIEDTSAHGHSWGRIRCTQCGQTFSVWSTPKSATTHAKQIRQFARRHGHKD